MSSKKEKRYIGIADDIEKRLERHNAGHVKSTKPYIPWNLVYAETYPDKQTARKREAYLKRSYHARKEIFDKLIKYGLIV